MCFAVKPLGQWGWGLAASPGSSASSGVCSQEDHPLSAPKSSLGTRKWAHGRISPQHRSYSDQTLCKHTHYSTLESTQKGCTVLAPFKQTRMLRNNHSLIKLKVWEFIHDYKNEVHSTDSSIGIEEYRRSMTLSHLQLVCCQLLSHTEAAREWMNDVKLSQMMQLSALPL